MSDKITLYGSPVCPMVGPVRRVLQQADAEFEYIDIFGDAEARQQLRQINEGLESVPTLVFADGSTLTEPSTAELRARLRAAGYQVKAPSIRDRFLALIENPLVSLAGLLLIATGALSGSSVLIVIGVLPLGLRLLLVRLG